VLGTSANGEHLIVTGRVVTGLFDSSDCWKGDPSCNLSGRLPVSLRACSARQT